MMDSVTVSILKAAVSEGADVLPDVAASLWKRMRSLIGEWSRDRESRVEGAIDDVVASPENTSLREVLATQIKAIPDEPADELRQLAEEMAKLIDADKKAAEATAGMNVTFQNVTGSAIAVSQVGAATATGVFSEKEPDPAAFDEALERVIRRRFPHLADQVLQSH